GSRADTTDLSGLRPDSGETVSSSRPEVRRRPRPIIEQPTYRAPSYHSRVWGRLIFFLFLLALCATILVGGGLYWGLHRAQSSSSRQVYFHVGAGDTVTTIADRLQRKGLINSALLFRVDARLQNLGGNLKVGDYVIQKNMSIDRMVGALQIPHTSYVNVVIPEGFRSEQIAAQLQRHGIDAASFLAEVRHPQLAFLNSPILRDKPRGASLEGYLFPNTYKVPRGYSGREFAKYMVQQLNVEFTPAMRGTAHRHGLSIYQTLTLAAIVEREAQVPSERPLIAGVYYNRLKDKMELGADPTVQFTLGTAHKWWPVLQNEARLIDPQSPYNTYTHYGLPPGPIANPGLSSISAAANPANTNYLYFVAKGNGHHAFAATLDQQTQNIAKYQHTGTP
ncbi:MAG TPA: endolytic transglycosylase MltG, partial [Chloroflexota bacterium]